MSVSLFFSYLFPPPELPTTVSSIRSTAYTSRPSCGRAGQGGDGLRLRVVMGGGRLATERM